MKIRETNVQKSKIITKSSRGGNTSASSSLKGQGSNVAKIVRKGKSATKKIKNKVKAYQRLKRIEEQRRKSLERAKRRAEREARRREKEQRYNALSTQDKLRRQIRALRGQITRLEKRGERDPLWRVANGRVGAYKDKLNTIINDIPTMAEDELNQHLKKVLHMKEMSSAKGLRETITKRAEGLGNFLLGSEGKEAKEERIKELQDQIAIETDVKKKSALEEELKAEKKKNININFQYDEKKDEYVIVSGGTESRLSSTEVSDFWEIFREAYDDAWLSNLKNYDKGEEGVNTVFDEYMNVKDMIEYRKEGDEYKAYIINTNTTIAEYLQNQIDEIVDEEKLKENALLNANESEFLQNNVSNENRKIFDTMLRKY